MPYVLVQHEVKNFDAWKQGFDAGAELRDQNGGKSAQVFTQSDNPNLITTIFEWDSFENAERFFFHTPELKAAMQKAGVLGQPRITTLNIS